MGQETSFTCTFARARCKANGRCSAGRDSVKSESVNSAYALEHSATVDPAISLNVIDEYPLTALQEGMLFHYLGDPASGVDVEQIVIDMPEEVDASTLEQAWIDVAAAQSMFRTAFVWQGLGRPMQRVLRDVRLPFTLHDW